MSGWFCVFVWGQHELCRVSRFNRALSQVSGVLWCCLSRLAHSGTLHLTESCWTMLLCWLPSDSDCPLYWGWIQQWTERFMLCVCSLFSCPLCVQTNGKAFEMHSVHFNNNTQFWLILWEKCYHYISFITITFILTYLCIYFCTYLWFHACIYAFILYAFIFMQFYLSCMRKRTDFVEINVLHFY